MSPKTSGHLEKFLLGSLVRPYPRNTAKSSRQSSEIRDDDPLIREVEEYKADSSKDRDSNDRIIQGDDDDNEEVVEVEITEVRGVAPICNVCQYTEGVVTGASTLAVGTLLASVSDDPDRPSSLNLELPKLVPRVLKKDK